MGFTVYPWMGVEVWLLVAALMLAAWLYSRWRHNYWSSHGILCPPYLPFLGHIHKRISLFQSRWDYLDEVYYKYGGSTMSGLYDMFHPVLMIGDPELLKHILVKDFDHFVDRRLFMAEDGSLINEMLSNKTGDEWRALRAVMTPTFTSGKMRSMFPLICDKADSLVSFTLKEASQKPYVDMKVNFGRFTMDTIASCAFGIECNSFTSEVPEFAKLAKTFFDFSLIRLIKFTFLNMYPKICNAIGIKIEPFSVKFFISVVEETIAARKAGQKRGDYLDLLLAARDGHLTQEVSTTHTQSTTTATENQVSITHDSNALETNKTFITSSKQVLTDRCIVAQCVLFLIAGYDTTAAVLAFSAFLLAKHPVHQQRLRQEVQQMVEEHGDITYQGVMEAKFLDACLMESMRLYPAGTFAERECTKTYKLPGTDVILRPGDLVTIPIWSLHHDPRYWPAPEVFLPDRFLPENKSNITNFTHMPFGMGPRSCIAMRFALMEAKVALAKLILKAKLRLKSGHEEVKVALSPVLLRPEGSIDVVITPLATSTQN